MDQTEPGTARYIYSRAPHLAWLHFRTPEGLYCARGISLHTKYWLTGNKELSICQDRRIHYSNSFLFNTKKYPYAKV